MPTQFKGFVLKGILLKIKFLPVFVAGLLALVSEACARNADASAIERQLSKLATKELPLPYDDALVPKIMAFQSEPLSGEFLRYESIFETELQKRNMPDAIKYLPLAMSTMQLDYTNGDCRGIWALPTLVALRYGLEVSEERDERLSVESSTKAALDYLSELYQQYGDWWMSMLAFSNSPNALQRAIVRSDNFLDLWDFYEQDLLANSHVISDFIAYDYVYSAYTPEQKSEALASFEKAEAKRLADEAQRLKEEETAKAEVKPNPEPEPVKPKVNYSTYTIKKGDNLGKIAKKYHVSVDSLMKWNNLNSDFIREGQKLKIKK